MKTIDLSGKVAVVTGAATGIGFTTAEHLAEAGADLFLHYRTPRARLQDLISKCEKLGRRVATASADFADDPGYAVGMVEQAVARLGQVDILVNNAAVTTKSEPIEIYSREGFEEMLTVNVTAVFLATQAAANDMIKRGKGGRIINVSSVHSRMSSMVAYATSKGAVNALTFTCAQSLAKYGITVNAIAPGLIWVERCGDLPPTEDTLGRIPLGRVGWPDDIADVMVFLASDAAGYITGETIFVDGGMTRRMAPR